MQNKPETYLHAGFFVRLAAYLLDSLIVGAVLLVVKIPFWVSSWGNPNNILTRDFIFSYSIVDIVLYLLGVSYFIILTYKTGATIGKRVMHLRVVSVEDRKPTLFEVAYRETVGRFLAELVVNVGYLMIGIHKEKHGLHDMLSDTEVIYYHEKKVYVDLQSETKEVAEATSYVAATYTEATKTEYQAATYTEAQEDQVEMHDEILVEEIDETIVEEDDINNNISK